MVRVPGLARRVDPVAAVLVALCPAALGILGGPVGAAVGVLAAVGWLAGPVFGFGVAQVGLVLVVRPPVDPLRLAALQVAVALLFLAGLREVEGAPRVAVTFVVLAVVLGGGTLVAIAADVAPGAVAATLAGVVAVTAYLLHRYELVALGLVDTPSDAETR